MTSLSLSPNSTEAAGRRRRHDEPRAYPLTAAFSRPAPPPCASPEVSEKRRSRTVECFWLDGPRAERSRLLAAAGAAKLTAASWFRDGACSAFSASGSPTPVGPDRAVGAPAFLGPETR